MFGKNKHSSKGTTRTGRSTESDSDMCSSSSSTSNRSSAGRGSRTTSK